MNYKFKPLALLSIDDLEVGDIHTLYEVTKEFKNILINPTNKPVLKNFTIANLFFEESTRTRTSFEIAQKRLSADVINFNMASSSIKKGETILDTIKNLLAMNLDLLIVRDKLAGTPAFLYQQTKIPIINAGDGTNEHPSQALLDLFTIWDIGLTMDNIHIHLTGDILHSRVAGSSIKLWKKMGISFSTNGPETTSRKTLKFLPKTKGVNIFYTLRIQQERLSKELIPSLKEYNQFFGLKTINASENIYVMHPGPINRGVEIDSEIADSSHSLILQQAETGVALRMAIIYLIGKKKEANASYKN